MAYQDHWVRGQVLEHGDRECETRYTLIRSVVASYQRPVTIWDIGANLGYFGHRLAAEFPSSVVVMAESRPVLTDVCRENALPNVIALTVQLDVADLLELSRCERPDVVLALNVLHHFGPDAEVALDCLRPLGGDLIIETPGRGDIRSAEYSAALNLLTRLESDPQAVLIGTAASHVTPGIDRPIFRLTHPSEPVVAGYVYGARVRSRGAHPPRAHVFDVTETNRQICYADGEARTFVPGMNLWNWLQLGGSYPSKTAIASAVQSAYEALPDTHGDFRPWNLILQGDCVVPIDAGHRRSCADAHGLRETLAWIDRPELAYV